jgi:hypothetical protein
MSHECMLKGMSNVPDEVHGTLKARAAREGMSPFDFVKQPTTREWLERVQELKPIPSKRSAAQFDPRIAGGTVIELERAP